MKQVLISSIMIGCSATVLQAQITEKQLEPFVGNYTLIDTSGPGLKNTSGDILLELKEEDNPDVETIMLLRNSSGKLSKIAENSDLLMGPEVLGVSGANYPSLDGNLLSVDYTIGSNSGQSDISMVFEKNELGHYLFKEYTSVARNYGVENLFARQKITVQQTGKITFSEADEHMILKRAGINPARDMDDQASYRIAQRYANYIPEGWRLAAFSEGDLNLDDFKKDLLLLINNEDSCRIQLLLQDQNSYKMVETNTALIVPGETFNTNNLKTIIKKGYFTIEQRIAISDNDFDHRYITFKYDIMQKSWSLYRYDVAHFSGFSPRPARDVSHLTQQNFGVIPFEKLDYTPGDYQYEPSVSTISGTLTIKQFYGRPNYGETPEKDEKVSVYILKSAYPVTVIAAGNQPDGETANKTIRGVTEIQVYDRNQNKSLSAYLGKKITLKGTLIHAESGDHYTKILMQVWQIEQ